MTTFFRLLAAGLRALPWAVVRLVRFPAVTLGRFLLWLSTANVEILREFPSDRAKYVGMGGAVLTTASVAGVSATFAISSELKPPMAWAVIFGVLWACAIMSFDRWLIAAAKPGVRGLPLMAARALIAVLIGIVVSTPIVLRIFQPEIDAEIPKVQAQFAADFTTEQTTNERGKRITFLQNEITRLNGELTSASFDPTKNADVVAADKRYKDAETAFQTAQTAYLCESRGGTGCPGGVGGSGIPGNGPRAAALYADMEQKRTARDTAKKDYDDILKKAQTDWATDNTAQTATINAQITADKAELVRLQGEVTTATDTFNENNRNDHGLLIQLEALDQLTKDRPTMGVAHRFLVAFFTIIECLPILLKTIMSFGRKNEYEEALETYNGARLAISRSRSRQYRAAQLITGGDLLTEAQAAREDRDKAIEDIARTTIKHQVELATIALNRWYRQEKVRAEQDPRGYIQHGPSQPPSIVQRHPYQSGLGPRDENGIPIVEGLTADGAGAAGAAGGARGQDRPSDGPFRGTPSQRVPTDGGQAGQRPRPGAGAPGADGTRAAGGSTVGTASGGGRWRQDGEAEQNAHEGGHPGDREHAEYRDAAERRRANLTKDPRRPADAANGTAARDQPGYHHQPRTDGGDDPTVEPNHFGDVPLTRRYPQQVAFDGRNDPDPDAPTAVP